MVRGELVRAAIWLASALLLTSARSVNAAELEGTRVAEMPLAVTNKADAVSPLELPLLDMFKGLAISDPEKRHIKRLLDAQESYDFNAGLSTVEILERSGFHYELHNCTSIDGYQTELVRIVNPLVDRKHLRQIPVVLYTGQGTSPAAFLAASLGSQRPVRWVPDDVQHEHHHREHHEHQEHQQHRQPVSVKEQHSKQHAEHEQYESVPVEHHHGEHRASHAQGEAKQHRDLPLVEHQHVEHEHEDHRAEHKDAHEHQEPRKEQNEQHDKLHPVGAEQHAAEHAEHEQHAGVEQHHHHQNDVGNHANHEEDHDRALHEHELPVEYREEHYADDKGQAHNEHDEPHEHDHEQHRDQQPTAAVAGTDQFKLFRRKRGAPTDSSLLQLDHHLLGENNRSLAAVLANSGYDVWIVPTRGVDKQNRRRPASGSRSVKKILENKLTLLKNMPPVKSASPSKETSEQSPLPLFAKLRELIKSFGQHEYWSFSSDEIIEYELEIQLERVRLATQREKVSLITYSNGGFIAFAFLAAHPGYALKHLDVVLNLAPAVYVNKFNFAYALAGLASHLTPPISAFPEETLHGLARQGLVQLCRAKTLRYSLCKSLLDQLYGPSDHAYRTHLELVLFDYIARPQSARGLRQTLQATREGALIHYDHGLLGNLLFYEQLTAPDYELRRVDHPRIYILAGERDALVDEGSLERLIAQLGTRPAKVIKIPGYNHLDLLAAHDNALRVNTPILQILNDRYLELDYYIEEGGKFGVEDLVRDIEHNRLNANDTGHIPADFSHYHVNGVGESEHQLDPDHLVHVMDPGFKVDESRVVNEELDAVPPITASGNSTTGQHHHEGHATAPAGRLSAEAMAAPVNTQQQQATPQSAQAAKVQQVTARALQESDHAQTIAAALQLLREDQQAPLEVMQQQLGQSHVEAI